MDKVFTLLKLLSYHQRKRILRIIRDKESIVKIHRFLYKVRSSENLEKSYNVSYYLKKEKFLCDCEGFSTTLEKIGKQFNDNKITKSEKDFLEKNFKCIHIYAVYIYLIKNAKT